MKGLEKQSGARSGPDRARPAPQGGRDTPTLGPGAILSVRNLTLRIAATPILDDVSVDLNAGEVLGIVGESGSGKSMTALAIMGLLPKQAHASGQIMLEGRDILPLPDRAKQAIRGQEIAMIFQEPMTALNPLHSIGDQVAETVRLHTRASRAEARARARDVLDRVGLSGPRFPLTKYPHELSGGQRQRVLIAMAIALRPKVLIADEPTTALDVTTQAEVLSLLTRLVEEDGMGLILITHDLAVVANIAQHIAIMEQGRIVEAGKVDTVFARQDHPYTRKLFAASAHQPDRTMARGDTPVLEVRDLVRDYALPRKHLFAKQEHFRAVNGVSFTLRQGENLGLVGESGCGKSTLARAILGLEPVQGGDIHLNGARVTDGMTFAQRRGIGVVFQDPYGSFNPRHKVGRLVAEPFHLLDDPPGRAERRERVADALRDVGLHADDMDKYIHAFSGGQRQRIAIARALVIRPSVIVLDEAVSALDVSIRAQILDLLAELSAIHTLSYLFISHDLSVVRAITDRVLVMKDGEIVEEGATERLFTSPEHRYTRTLLAASPRLPDRGQTDAP
ncbi:peptide/nickel transport system ATP-binding protein [Rubricella aquisinus]|uniref:Peptide/nickel transport system ATP-binding protein n=1 Tax=Rubricella aquisinus TaxID=2028108 RepID=A0A840WGR7_9RHOB|nr:dipeptide ABC transporter ATP-binding protein [Rubricella aquisinus]MBB5514329.1 peptide/nickel transport system ATP-binding protein [Rubricella aquisinus]